MGNLEDTYDKLEEIRESIDAIDLYSTSKKINLDLYEEINNATLKLRELRNIHIRKTKLTSKKYIDTSEEIEKYCMIFCESNNTTIEEIKSKSRYLEVIKKRQALQYYLCEMFTFSYSSVKRYLGFHHSTIMHNCKVVKEQHCRYEKYLKNL